LTLPRPTLVLIASAVIAVSLLAGCAREETVVGLELELLVTQRENFEGRRVRTSGVVRSHADPRHFWLENDALQRVGLAPAEQVEAWLGQEVEVVGRFTFAADTGRRITVEQVSPVTRE
jgi:hypothetical protein